MNFVFWMSIISASLSGVSFGFWITALIKLKNHIRASRTETDRLSLQLWEERQLTKSLKKRLNEL